MVATVQTAWQILQSVEYHHRPWEEYLIAADACEEAGEEILARGLRVMEHRRKSPIRGGQHRGGWYWSCMGHDPERKEQTHCFSVRPEILHKVNKDLTSHTDEDVWRDFKTFADAVLALAVVLGEES